MTSQLNSKFDQIPLAQIAPSLTNPRKQFNAAKLEELAASIKASGVHQPVLVRPLPASRVPETDRAVQYELVAGERRLRASVMAGAPSIPAMIRALSDSEVLEIQIVENLQRDDLAELEEAEGYQQLMDHSSINADQVGDKIGKSRSYVYGRLKLLDLCMECRQALREGVLDASRALLIARIPDGKLQLKALEYARTPAGYPSEVPSFRNLQNWLKDNVMLKLDHAVFSIKDARLVEEAGSCDQCPKRTGANPDLFSDVQSANICTDPRCFHHKEEAHRAALVKKAEAKGMRIVQGKEASELLGGYTWKTEPDGYSNLADKRPDLSDEGERVKTLGQALGKDAPAPILFIHPKTQAVIELVPHVEAEAVLLAKGLVKANAAGNQSAEDLAAQIAQLEQEAKQEVFERTQRAQHEAAIAAIRATTKAQASKLLTADVLRGFLLEEIDLCGAHEIAEMCEVDVSELEEIDSGLQAHIERLGEAEIFRIAALMMLDRDKFNYRNVSTPHIRPVFVKQLEIDTKAIERSAKAQVKKEYAEKIKAVQAQIDAQKASAAPGSAARQDEGAGEDKAVPKLRKRALKLGTKEAEQGIAAAMQSLDQAASASAVAPPAEPAGAKVLAIGVQVTITSNTDQLHPRVHKYAGKRGTITAKIGDAAWDVSFKGRTGGLASFATKELMV
jgi:ParB/RepB/Spo0J family partition protein